MGGLLQQTHSCKLYQLLRVTLTDNSGAKGQRDRLKRKSKRAFIPATSFLITVIGVQQKKKKRKERANRTRMSTKAKMTVEAIKPSQDVERNV